MFRRSSSVVMVAATAVACANGEQFWSELVPRYVGTGGVDADMPVNGGAKSADGGEGANGRAGNGGTTPTVSGGTRSSGGAVGRGGASGGAFAATGGRRNVGGSAAGGAAGATMDGGAGVGSGGAAGASMGGNGGEAPCGSNQKRCSGACMPRTPLNGCNGTTCTACPGPAPAFGQVTCNAMGECAFDCLPGFKINGNSCVSSTGAGGGTGMTDGGSLVCGFTSCTPCPSPYITCCERTTGNACLCAPPDYASMLCS